MKKSIVLSLFMALSVKASACIWMGTHNYYLFSVTRNQDWVDYASNITDDNWRAYMKGGAIKPNEFFNMEDVQNYAQQHHDVAMVNYVSLLRKYLWCSDLLKGWDYPTKAELQKRKRLLATIRETSSKMTQSKLRSQYSLLYMRSNMLLGFHQENIKFWEGNNVRLKNTIYKDMMRDIYAGALYRNNRKDEAAEIYAELGDWSSIFQICDKQRNYKEIRKLYERNPNSPLLPYLVQDFVNNAQETLDAMTPEGQEEYAVLGRWNVRSVYRKECQDMISFCLQAAHEGKSRQPVLWQSAAAWINYLYGNKGDAYKQIREARAMDGNARQEDNAEAIFRFMELAIDPMNSRYDARVVNTLEWLRSKCKADSAIHSDHYHEVADRLMAQVLTPRYEQAHRQNTHIALHAYWDRMWPEQQDTFYGSQGEYATQLFQALDTLPVSQVEAYRDYLLHSQESALDEYLRTHTQNNDQYMQDILGTRYLRLGNLQKAEQYLRNIPLSLVDEQGIAFYMAHRDYHVEPWMRWQIVDGVYPEYDDQYKRIPIHLKSNQKLTFVREVLDLQARMKVADEATRQQLSYQLAVLYAQASVHGSCWYLLRYAINPSQYRTDSFGYEGESDHAEGDFDYVEETIRLLNDAASSNDFRLKEKALYALAWVPDTPWGRVEVWSGPDQGQRDFRRSRRNCAFLNLQRFVAANPSKVSRFVSHCDEFRNYQDSVKVWKKK